MPPPSLKTSLLQVGKQEKEALFARVGDRVPEEPGPPAPSLLSVPAPGGGVKLTQSSWRKAPDKFKVIVTVAFAGKLYSVS